MLKKYLIPLICLLLIAWTSWRLWSTFHHPYVRQKLSIDLIMGTDASLEAVVLPGKEESARKAIDTARKKIEQVEDLMSHYRADSEIGRLNSAPVGTPVKLSAETIHVLKLGQQYTAATAGTFDITCGPLMQLWDRAGKENRIPTPQQIADARAITGWGNFQWLPDGLVRLCEGCRIDPGGIAKKYAINQALQLMRNAQLQGALVNVGGDIACFGTNDRGRPWTVSVKDPFDPSAKDDFFILSIPGGCVFTSGDYERFVTINGKRYSHIKDPRTGMPADLYPSVTVIGPNAVEAGVWATALSILGPEGLKLMPKDHGLEALIVAGDKDHFTLHFTPGFDHYIISRGPMAKSADKQ